MKFTRIALCIVYICIAQMACTKITGETVSKRHFGVKADSDGTEKEDNGEDTSPEDAVLENLPFAAKSQILEESYSQLKGPQSYSIINYASVPAVDPQVIDPAIYGEVNVDARGVIYVPSEATPQNPSPVIVILTGNHSSCGLLPADSVNPRLDFNSDYRLTGACPEGFVEAPSHLGYEYLAEYLTSWGFFVISINPNLGIQGFSDPRPDSDDVSFINTRAALIAKNIQYLQVNQPEAAAMNFNQLGLIGHSRGGDAVRAFQNLYTDLNNVTVQSILELAPVDGGTGFGNALYDPINNVPWSVLIAACDGDLISYPGIHPFERIKNTRSYGSLMSIVSITGANHNFFNTEWQAPDSFGCSGDQTELWDISQPLSPEAINSNFFALAGVKGSADQRLITRYFVTNFFLGSLGDNPREESLRAFLPNYELPSAIRELSSVVRETIDYSLTSFVGISETTGSVGEPSVFFSPYSLDDIYRTTHNLTWQRPNSQLSTNFKLNLEAAALAEAQSIQLNIARKSICQWDLPQDSCPEFLPADFSIQLVDSTGLTSLPIFARNYIPAKNIDNRDLEFTRGGSNVTKPLLFDSLALSLPAMRGKMRSTIGTDFNVDDTKTIRFVYDRSPSATVYLDADIFLNYRPVAFSDTSVGQSMALYFNNRTEPKKERRRPSIDYNTFKAMKLKHTKR